GSAQEVGRRMNGRSQTTMICPTDLADADAWSSEAEAHALHRALDVLIAHEPVPDISGQQIFHTKERNADVNADDILVHPQLLVFPVWIEGVREAVGSIDLVPIDAAHFSQHGKADFRSEHERSGDGARHQGPVDGTHIGRTAPTYVAGGAV